MATEFDQLDWNAEVEDDCRQLVRLAVREDLDRAHDWTTVSLVEPQKLGRAAIVARQEGIVAGLPAARLALAEMDSRVEWTQAVEDGARVAPGATLATVAGPARSLLTAERLVLNFIGHLSGIATLTRRYVEAVAGTNARIYDTRKTMPGWRRLEKYAVRSGGGHNHRTGLFDAILIKDNHLALMATHQPPTPGATATANPGATAGRVPSGCSSAGAASAVRRARNFLSNLPPGDVRRDMIVEVEVESLGGLEEVLAAGPDIVLLDNMPPEKLRAAVAVRDAVKSPAELEASGGVNLQTIAAIAATGVDRISVGGLTHSAAWFDVALDWLN